MSLYAFPREQGIRSRVEVFLVWGARSAIGSCRLREFLFGFDSLCPFCYWDANLKNLFWIFLLPVDLSSYRFSCRVLRGISSTDLFSLVQLCAGRRANFGAVFNLSSSCFLISMEGVSFIRFSCWDITVVLSVVSV